MIVIEKFDNYGRIIACENKSAQTVNASLEKVITLSKSRPNLAEVVFENDFVKETFNDFNTIGNDGKDTHNSSKRNGTSVKEDEKISKQSSSNLTPIQPVRK